MLQRLRGWRDVQRPGEVGQVHTAHPDQEPQRPGQHLQLLLHLLTGGRISLEKDKYVGKLFLFIHFLRYVIPEAQAGQQPPAVIQPLAHNGEDLSAVPGTLSVWPLAQSGTQ